MQGRDSLPSAGSRPSQKRHRPRVGQQRIADQRLVRNLFDSAPSTLLIGTLVAGVVFFAVSRTTGNDNIVWWLVTITVITATRLASLGTLKRRLGQSQVRSTGYAYAATAFLAGISWALIAGFDDPTHAVGTRLMILVTLVAMPVASLSSNAIYLPVFYAFSLPIFIALYVWAWSAIPDMAFEFTLLAASYTGLVLIMANRYNQNLKRSLVRDIENEALLHEVNTMNGELQRMAYQDPLTGLSNRRFFEETTIRLLQRRRDGEQLALMLIDLDKFKWINDNLGHAAGDATLVELSRRIEDNSRISEIVTQTQMGAARIGGDEFVVLYRLGAETAIEPMATRILDALTAPMEIGGKPYSPGVSIGIALAPKHAEKLDALLSAADNAMYAAKSAGGSRYVIADEHSARTADDRTNM